MRNVDVYSQFNRFSTLNMPLHVVLYRQQQLHHLQLPNALFYQTPTWLTATVCFTTSRPSTILFIGNLPKSSSISIIPTYLPTCLSSNIESYFTYAVSETIYVFQMIDGGLPQSVNIGGFVCNLPVAGAFVSTISLPTYFHFEYKLQCNFRLLHTIYTLVYVRRSPKFRLSRMS